MRHITEKIRVNISRVNKHTLGVLGPQAGSPSGRKDLPDMADGRSWISFLPVTSNLLFLTIPEIECLSLCFCHLYFLFKKLNLYIFCPFVLFFIGFASKKIIKIQSVIGILTFQCNICITNIFPKTITIFYSFL